MRARQVSGEVYYADETIVRVNQQDIDELVAAAAPQPRLRTRLCTHQGVDDRLHEMLIVHHREAYVRPHRHFGKAESMHIIRGDVDLVLFDEAGAITEAIAMGEFGTGRAFYYRMSDAIYHSLIIRSEWLVFHEVTTGPFRREETAFAPWAPEDADAAGVAGYRSSLEQELRAFRGAGDRR